MCTGKLKQGIINQISFKISLKRIHALWLKKQKPSKALSCWSCLLYLFN